MFLKNTAYFFFILVTGLVLSACKKAPNYSKEPVIAFMDLQAFKSYDDGGDGDSVYVSVHFQDGDGDLGNEPATTNDYFATLFRKTNGVFTELTVVPPATAAPDFDGKLPLFSPYTLTGPIDGNIRKNIFFPFVIGNAYGLNQYDTLRFEVQIKDRANNYSNTVTTSEFVLWKDL